MHKVAYGGVLYLLQGFYGLTDYFLVELDKPIFISPPILLYRLQPRKLIHALLILQDECFEALESISRKINTNDADMRSHVILSMVKVAAAEADVPDLPPSGSYRLTGLPALVLVFNVLLIHYVTMSISHIMTSNSYSSYRTCQYLWRKLQCYYHHCYYPHIAVRVQLKNDSGPDSYMGHYCWTTYNMYLTYYDYLHSVSKILIICWSSLIGTIYMTTSFSDFVSAKKKCWDFNWKKNRSSAKQKKQSYNLQGLDCWQWNGC